MPRQRQLGPTLAYARTRLWKTTRVLTSGWLTVPVGTTVRVTGKHNGASIAADACPHCGVRIYMSRVPWLDLDDIGPIEGAGDA